MAEPTNTVTADNGSTVTVLVEPAPADPQRIADMAELAGLFFVAALSIFLLRRLLDLFRVDQDD